MTRGKFITFEGGEGAGKSTQVARLADTLRTEGYDVVLSREPGGTPGAEEIRQLLVEGETGRWRPEAETLLLFAARSDHLQRIVEPALARGAWVVCDRFVDSTRAYQGFGLGVSQVFIDDLTRAVVGSNMPDLTIVLDMPTEIAFERAGRRSGALARYERMGSEFHRRVRAGFLTIVAQNPARCVLVDAVRSIDVVAAEVREIVHRRLGSSPTS